MKQTQATGMGREFFRYALPSVTGMVISSLYTVVDGIFVGRGVGELALGAINIVYPFIMLQIALTMWVAIGGANLYSISAGREDPETAQSAFRHSVLLIGVIAVAINLLAVLFPQAACTLLGADGELMGQSAVYLRWMALFGFLYMPGLGISIFVRNDGNPTLDMVGTLCGALTNIVLDYLFIMRFGWGVEGAAVASGIGQMVSVTVWMLHFLKKKRSLRFGRLKPAFAVAKKIMLNGFSSFLMEFSQSAVTLSFNVVLMAHLGAVGVSAYSIVMYVCSMFNMVLIGIVQGAQPIISFQHGAGNRENETRIYRMGVGTSLVLTALFYGIVYLFGGSIASLFTPGNPELQSMAGGMMRLYFLGFFPIGVSLMNILYFQATEREGRSILISFLRCIGFVQLSLLILPARFGLSGIALSLLTGELLNCAVSVFFYWRTKAESGANQPSVPEALSPHSNRA